MDFLLNQYVLVLFWVALMAFVGHRLINLKTETVLGQETQRVSWLFAILTILPLLFFTASRVVHGFGDTASYHDAFIMMPNELSGIGEYLENVDKDHAFAVLSILIRVLISQDYVVYFFIIAAIQCVLLVYVYRKYSEDFSMSMALFVISTDYIAWMHNGIRQFTAVTIILATTTLILRKKYLPVFAIIFFASLFHRSALIMIPLVIILQGKAWNKKTLVFIIFTILAITFVGEFTNLVDSSMQDTQYKNVVWDYTYAKDDGTNPFRALVYAIPTIIAFIGRKEIINSDNKLIHFCTNASLISTGLYVVSIFTSGIFFGRLPIYVSLYNYILLPWEIKHIIPEHIRKPFVLLMFVLYSVFYYYQVSVVWNLV